MQNKFIRNVSASTLQLLFNQVFGLLIFYALSKGLDKTTFGQINWCLAVLLAVFGMLTFGIDQVMVRRIAAGYNRQSVFTAYLLHVLSSGGIFYGLMLLLYCLFPARYPQQSFLLLIGIGKLCIFLSTPCKQLAAGLEKFKALLFMSVGSNIIRGSGLLVLLWTHQMTVRNVMVIFIAGDLLELLLCMAVARPLLQTPYRIGQRKKLRVVLLKESLPQTGVVICTAIMSRLDWILIGLLVSSSKLAEYSFAWKAFEVASLPLLVIAPVMIPLFTRMFTAPASISGLSFFLEWQIIVASFIALLLNICWTPVIDLITNGKYGAVNAGTIFLLSLSMPLLYVNNYLWTINFAKGKLKRIFFIIAMSFIVNVAACGILIPRYQNEGAAFAYLLTLLVQLVLYCRNTGSFINTPRLLALFTWPLVALLTGLAVKRWITDAATGIALAAGVYLAIVLTSKQLRTKDWKTLQSYYHS